MSSEVPPEAVSAGSPDSAPPKSRSPEPGVRDRHVAAAPTMVNIGYGNLVTAARVIAIVSPSSSPMRRLREEAGLRGKLLDATENTGVTLSDNYAMSPASSVSGFYYSHPEAKYFAVGKIGKDQVEDIAARKGESVATTERWLRPNLNY